MELSDKENVFLDVINLSIIQAKFNSDNSKMSESLYQESLAYHRAEPRGKFSVEPTKPMNGQKDLSLAYSPGVAQPCLEIAKDPDAAYEYTNKGKFWLLTLI